VTHVDLIGLDSPFIERPISATSSTLISADPDFESLWDNLENFNSRGWCEKSTDAVVRRLQSLQQRLKVISEDQGPFKGELKVLVLPKSGDDHGLAALRLKESDDNSCLWRLRCEDENLRRNLQVLLSDI